jgi:D-glycero-D-manno-heptose 1,7-bisphosphate phosphatase
METWPKDRDPERSLFRRSRLRRPLPSTIRGVPRAETADDLSKAQRDAMNRMEMPARRAIIFDRDGTLIVERHYLHDPAEVVLEREVIGALRRLHDLGFVFVVISNQSGVGRGYFDQEAVEAINKRVDELLLAGGVKIEAWYVCPHAPDHGCDCRKPRPGLAHRAAQELHLDFPNSWVIGDKRSDIELAFSIGANGILLMSGQGQDASEWAKIARVPVAYDMAMAADLISTFESGNEI